MPHTYTVYALLMRTALHDMPHTYTVYALLMRTALQYASHVHCVCPAYAYSPTRYASHVHCVCPAYAYSPAICLTRTLCMPCLCVQPYNMPHTYTVYALLMRTALQYASHVHCVCPAYVYSPTICLTRTLCMPCLCVQPCNMPHTYTVYAHNFKTVNRQTGMHTVKPILSDRPTAED